MRGNGPRPQHRQIKGGKGKLLDILVHNHYNEDEYETTVCCNGSVMGLVPRYHILQHKQSTSNVSDYLGRGKK